jgi:hypothetical protein
MTYLGEVKNGVIVLSANTFLPDGTSVKIEPIDVGDRPATSLRNMKPSSLGKMIRPLSAEDDLLDEMINHDRD